MDNDTCFFGTFPDDSAISFSSQHIAEDRGILALTLAHCRRGHIRSDRRTTNP